MPSYNFNIADLNWTGEVLQLAVDPARFDKSLVGGFQGTCVIMTSKGQLPPAPGKKNYSCAGTFRPVAAGGTARYAFYSSSGPLVGLGLNMAGAELLSVMFTPSDQSFGARFGQQAQQVRQAPGQSARFGQQETCTGGGFPFNSCGKGDSDCVAGVCVPWSPPTRSIGQAQGQQVRQAPGQIARFGQQYTRETCTGSFPHDTCKGDSNCVAGVCEPGPVATGPAKCTSSQK